ncbi:stAR-related lipid transfer protein 3-like [Pollicipes pollicipes]|uniref:stAR-related lipid transfer protein 3-like n=1 Tax=Pollicipes pollicipes TaxID=41117 RepID=UPI001884BC94|nr:stAR-related lipid transfer protein 3-like [Pollicipes pollicipes]
MAGGLVPMFGRLLAAGSPSAIKTIRAGLMLANSPYCITLPDRKQLSALIPRSETDPFGAEGPRAVAPRTPQKALSKEELDLKELAETNCEKALEILQADGWHQVDSEEEDGLFVRDSGGRTIWKFRTVIKCCPEKFAQELLHKCENCPSWNQTIQQCHQTHRIADGVEIIHQVTGLLFGGVVSKREFVNLRRLGRRGDMHYSAVASIEHRDLPLRSSFVRALNFPTVLTVSPMDGAPNHCVVEGTLNYDLKLRMVPQLLIQRGTLSVWRQLRTQMLALAERVRG